MKLRLSALALLCGIVMNGATAASQQSARRPWLCFLVHETTQCYGPRECQYNHGYRSASQLRPTSECAVTTSPVWCMLWSERLADGRRTRPAKRGCSTSRQRCEDHRDAMLRIGGPGTSIPACRVMQEPDEYRGPDWDSQEVRDALDAGPRVEPFDPSKWGLDAMVDGGRLDALRPAD